MEKVIAYSPDWTIKLFSASCVVIDGACVLGNAIVTGDGGAGDADIYDGVNDKAELKYHLEALTGVSFSIGTGQDRVMNKGIFVKINNATTFVMVAFRTPSKEEKESEKD